MTILFVLVLAIGLAPLLLGLALLRSGGRLPPARLWAAAMLSCALAFNLTFFWQELWLVLPKALTPGLHPVLYHNDHDWTGSAPIAELLQGTGALATLASGLAFAAALTLSRRASPAWSLLLFWMGFQGLFQALSQAAIGTILPGNDVGRALAYLHLGPPAKAALLACAVAAMAAAGAWLARACPIGPTTRATGWAIAITALASVILVIPFRLPRSPVEVALIPLIVNLIGAGWLVLGLALTRGRDAYRRAERPTILAPALALVVLLLIFQFVLRPGIQF